ncbi:MAG TPA: hypothetical protein VNB91_14930 [Jatrophihabitantaceae bacterium]|jgi:hypothetical protein|nr:hypothetical protein [Jatrophihabitantaceae bacterium]
MWASEGTSPDVLYSHERLTGAVDEEHLAADFRVFGVQEPTDDRGDLLRTSLPAQRHRSFLEKPALLLGGSMRRHGGANGARSNGIERNA